MLPLELYYYIVFITEILARKRENRKTAANSQNLKIKSARFRISFFIFLKISSNDIKKIRRETAKRFQNTLDPEANKHSTERRGGGRDRKSF